MRRLIIFVTSVGMALVGLTAVAGATQAKVSGPNGQIVFAQFDPVNGTVLYTINPDGSHRQKLFAGADGPHWSPDGSQVSFFCCGDNKVAHIINVDNGAFREISNPDPTLDLHCGPWSADGTKLACESSQPDSARTGVWTISSADGSGLKQITSNPGGDDIPGDFSPDGKSLVYFRLSPTGDESIDVVRLNGTGLHQITPPGMSFAEPEGDEFPVSWSPSGNTILFAAQADPSHRSSIWAVNSDGGGLHQLAIPGCGGAFSDLGSVDCRHPGWSPDGTKIVFARSARSGVNIYTVNRDGSGLFQVTRNGRNIIPDWGTHPLAG